MNTFSNHFTLGILGLLGCFGTATAATTEQARVLSSLPIIQKVAVQRPVCHNQVITHTSNSGGGALLGGVVGAGLGNQVQHGNAALTAIGFLGGALIGNQLEGQTQQSQTVRTCTQQTFYESQTIGYQVVYEYAGKQYTTQTTQDPGPWLTLNIEPVSSVETTPVVVAQPAPVVVVAPPPTPHPCCGAYHPMGCAYACGDSNGLSSSPPSQPSGSHSRAFDIPHGCPLAQFAPYS